MNETARTPEVDEGAPSHRLARVLDGVAVAEKWIAAALLVLLVVVALAQVVARYVLQQPLASSDELARFTLIWAAFLAAALTQHGDQHIAVLLLRSRGSAARRRRLRVVANLAALVTAVVILVLSVETLSRSALVSSPSLGVPMATVYLGVVLGFLLIALHSVRNLAVLLAAARHGHGDREDGGALTDEMRLT